MLPPHSLSLEEAGQRRCWAPAGLQLQGLDLRWRGKCGLQDMLGASRGGKCTLTCGDLGVEGPMEDRSDRGTIQGTGWQSGGAHRGQKPSSSLPTHSPCSTPSSPLHSVPTLCFPAPPSPDPLPTHLLPSCSQLQFRATDSWMLATPPGRTLEDHKLVVFAYMNSKKLLSLKMGSTIQR